MSKPGPAMPEVRIGDIVRLRKAHPCGGDRWQVTRVGSDIGLRCLTCGRLVLLGRTLFRRRLRAVLSAGPEGRGA